MFRPMETKVTTKMAKKINRKTNAIAIVPLLSTGSTTDKIEAVIMMQVFRVLLGQPLPQPQNSFSSP
jgi:hypothetical protein